MNCILLPLLIMAGALVVWAVRQAQYGEGNFGFRLPTFFGAAMVLASFFFLPWLEFSPMRYLLDQVPEAFRDLLPGALGNLFKAFGQRAAGDAFEFILGLVGLPGWMLVFAIPSFDLFGRFVLILIPVVASISLFWFTLNIFLPPTSFGRVIGGLQTFFAFLAAILLLIEMPTLDALTLEQNLTFRFVAVLLGAHLGWGVWVAWVGLLLLGCGGLIEATNQWSAPDFKMRDEEDPFKTTSLEGF